MRKIFAAIGVSAALVLAPALAMADDAAPAPKTDAAKPADGGDMKPAPKPKKHHHHHSKKKAAAPAAPAAAPAAPAADAPK